MTAHATPYDPTRPYERGYTVEEIDELARSGAGEWSFLRSKATEIHAKYKVELFFAKPRVFSGPSFGLLTIWSNGGQLHGGGDELLHLCPGKRIGKNNCEAVLPELSDGHGQLVCPVCMTAWNGDQVTGQVLYNIPLKDYADVLAYWFVRLGCSVDFVIKHSYEDLAAATRAVAEQVQGRDRVDNLRRRRVRYIYRASALLRDTSSGATLVSTLRSFVTA